MNPLQEDHLTNEEKNLIAMGAAMGAGCRTCADKLHGVALSLKIPEEEMLKAFHLGLIAKSEAVKTMTTKIATLIGDHQETNPSVSEGGMKKLTSLARIASFVAANSAPDVLSEIQKAEANGITPDQIKMCINLGKMVRKNAMAFSDQEISDKVNGFRTGPEEMCCPLSPASENASACSCT
ncbi:MAG: hypothetical protein L7F78_00435 [Syntrophales bacterium LBB04]|nr:hypothetical protein [Syntrophales bacterium LBB04]